MISGNDLEICFSVDENLIPKAKKSKNILDAFYIRRTSNCD